MIVIREIICFSYSRVNAKVAEPLDMRVRFNIDFLESSVHELLVRSNERWILIVYGHVRVKVL